MQLRIERHPPIIEHGPEHELNENFLQSLWSDSVDGKIDKKAIQKNLYNFIIGISPDQTNTTPKTKSFKSRFKVYGNPTEILMFKILNKIRKGTLNHLHKNIKNKTGEDMEMKSNHQIILIIRAIEEVLNDPKISVEDKRLLGELFRPKKN